MSDRVADWLQQRARSHAASPALFWNDQVVSFAALAARAAAYDAALCAAGARAGTRVAVLVHNRPELAALVHGVPRRGRVLVPLGTRLTAHELAAQIEDSDCRVVVYEQSTRATAAALRERARFTGLCLDAEVLPGDVRLRDDLAAEAAPPIDLDVVHSIVFTSGSSGRAKGVLLSWGNHFFNAAGSALHLGVRGDDRWLACLPMHHVGGLSILLRGAIYGMPVVLQPRFEPERVNRAIDRDGVTIVSVVANMLARLLDARDCAPFPPSLRCVLLGGGPVPRALVARCRELAVPLYPTYGMTETASQIATATAQCDDAAAGGVGPPLLGAEVRIRGDGERCCAAGEVGRIEVRGPIVSRGYVGGPARPRGAWFATGDLGSLDAQGNLRVLGRGDDTVICGGENIHPGEIERALECHPAVVETCAFGVPDERWGQRLVACVRLRDGARASDAELRAHCAALLAGFKVPRQFHVVADFPRTAAGKIARHLVPAAVAAATA